MAHLLAHVRGEQLATFTTVGLLVAQQEVADVQQLQQPAVSVRLHPAPGVHNVAACPLKREVQTLALPVHWRAFECQRAAGHQIINQQARRAIAHDHTVMLRAVYFQNMALRVEPHFNPRLQARRRTGGHR